MEDSTHEAVKNLISSFEDLKKSTAECSKAFNKLFRETTRAAVLNILTSRALQLLKSYIFYSKLSNYIPFVFPIIRDYKLQELNKIIMLSDVTKNLKRTPYRLIMLELSEVPSEGVSSMEQLEDGTVVSYLTETEYQDQLSDPWSTWVCPVTKKEGWFDDDWFESEHEN